MKKLMCAVAALTAGICCADVTSANVVGYQTMKGGNNAGDIKIGEKNTMCPTFLTVGKEQVRLGDIQYKNFSTGTSPLQLLNAYGATAKVTPELIGAEAFDAFPTAYAEFINVTEEDADEYDLPAGWYLPDDWEGDGAYPMNDVLLKKGQGFVIQANDANLEVTYAGQVEAGEEFEIALAFNVGEKNVLGNITPVDLVLGDVVYKNFSTGTSPLQFLNAYGATAKVTEEMIGAEAFAAFPTAYAEFINVTEEDADEYDLPAGWYLPDDWEGDGAYPMNGVNLPAGQAFVVQVNDAELIITIPSALKPAAK